MMKGSTMGWVIGAVVIIVIILGAWWWNMGSSAVATPTIPTPTPTAQATPTPVAHTTTSTTNSVVGQTRTGNLVTVLSQIPNASSFASALNSTGASSLVGGKGPYTIFVPLNSSWGAIPQNLSAADMKRLIQYHIISGKNIDVNIQQTGTVQALSKDMLNFSVRPGDKSARVNSSVALEKYTTTNGTIYLIDQVLLPPQAPLQ